MVLECHQIQRTKTSFEWVTKWKHYCIREKSGGLRAYIKRGKAIKIVFYFSISVGQETRHENSGSAQWSRTPWKVDKNISLSHELRSEWVSERANEWAQRSARAKRAVRSKRMSERCERTSERMSEWPITNIPITRFSESLCMEKLTSWTKSSPIRFLNVRMKRADAFIWFQ